LSGRKDLDLPLLFPNCPIFKELRIQQTAVHSHPPSHILRIKISEKACKIKMDDSMVAKLTVRFFKDNS
jgi:hypothetical protein